MINVLAFVSDKLSVKRMKTDFALLPLTQTARHANYMGPSSVRHTLDDRRATLHTPTYQPWYVLWCNPKLDYKAATARLLMWTLPAVLCRVNLCRQCSSRDGDSGRRNGDNYVKVIKTLPDQKLFRSWSQNIWALNPDRKHLARPLGRWELLTYSQLLWGIWTVDLVGTTLLMLIQTLATASTACR